MNRAEHLAWARQRALAELDAGEPMADQIAAAALGQTASTPDGVALIAAERARQVAVEGWTPQHDDQYLDGQMPSAAMSYVQAAILLTLGTPPEIIARYRGGTGLALNWPDGWRFAPGADPLRNLIKAGALIAAEIDRIQRAALDSPAAPPAGSADAATGATETAPSPIGPGSVPPSSSAPCRSCRRPFSPTHDADAPGPTSRHPYKPILSPDCPGDPGCGHPAVSHHERRCLVPGCGCGATS